MLSVRKSSKPAFSSSSSLMDVEGLELIDGFGGESISQSHHLVFDGGGIWYQHARGVLALDENAIEEVFNFKPAQLMEVFALERFGKGQMPLARGTCSRD